MTPQPASQRGENRRLLGKIALVTAGAFAFCFALVPLYRIACEQVFGIRMSDSGAVSAGANALAVDLERTVRVQFDASIHNESEWQFVPDQVEMQVHPGRDWFFVLSGTVKLLLGEREILVHAGHVADFSTMTPHAFTAHLRPAELISILDSDGHQVHTA